MLGNRRIRTAIATTGAAALLLGLGTFGTSPVGAESEIVEVAGHAYGITGEITMPPEVPGDPDEVLEIDPVPEVFLPADGEGSEEQDDELTFNVTSEAGLEVLDIFAMQATTQGDLPDDTFIGGSISDTLIDNLLLLDVIEADEIRSSCILDTRRELAGVELEGVFVNGDEMPAEPDPNTEVEVADFGTVRFNVQEIVGNRVQVVAMEVDFDIEDGPSGELQFGLAECGIEVLDETVVPDFVPDTDPADAFDGDPEFTG
jgi:hypothetical protein